LHKFVRRWFNVVEKNDGLEHLAPITRAHEPCDGTMPGAAGASNDPPRLLGHNKDTQGRSSEAGDSLQMACACLIAAPGQFN
jgi:hypothetical protein